MSKSSAVIHKEKRINAISTRTNVLLLCILAVFALLCVLPVLLVVIVSFSSEQSIFRNGYTFFPTEFSLNAIAFSCGLGIRSSVPTASPCLSPFSAHCSALR